MTKVAGDPTEAGKKLVIISTHSTEFVRIRAVNDLACMIFCVDVDTQPIQADASTDEFRDRQIRGLLSRLGHEHKSALFCRRPLLVEGVSDQIVCAGLSRELNLNVEAGGSHILPISGKGQMQPVVKLLRLLGKKPVVLADADALADGLELTNLFTLQEEAKRIASEMGHKGAQVFANNIHSDFSQMVERNWDDIKEYAIKHRYWKCRDGEEFIAKRRATFSTLIVTCDETVEKWNNGAEWKALRARYLSLLKVLGELGCFILRRGTIEDYYNYVVDTGRNDKPYGATQEADQLEGMGSSEVEQSYGDIIEAIKFASQTEEIREARAIRDAILALVAPALANVSEGRTDGEIVAYCRELLGSRASLFKIEVERENGRKLLVHLNSPILEVEGFPLCIGSGENPVAAVNQQMKMSSA